MEEPIHVCPFCGKPPKNDWEEFCNDLCELDYNYTPKPKSLAQVIRMGTDIDGNLYVAE